MKKHMKAIVLLLLFLCLNGNLFSKTIHYVKIDGTGDGSSWANAAGNIQTMLDKAVSGDEVWVAKGTYYPTTETIARDARSRTFILKGGVNCYGGFVGSETTISERALSDLDKNGKVDSFEFVNTTLLSGDIDGVADVWTKAMSSDGKTWKWMVTGNEGNCYNVVTGEGATTFFDGFSVIGGNANISSNNNGGGIYVASSSNSSFIFYITNCTVWNCFATNGGGVCIAPSTHCRIINCAINNCYASIGGGIRVDSSSSSYFITNCTISNCYASSGGGIHSQSSNFNNSKSYVTNCTVWNCSAISFGGGICASGTHVTNCTVCDCSATNGGGIYSYSVNCKVSNCSASNGGGIYGSSVNCTVSNCSASNGGGIYGSSVNCTVSNCSASGDGGGLYATNPSINSTISNCSALGSGGGIYINNPSIHSINCATSNNIANNSVSNFFGGIQIGNITPDYQIVFVKPTSFVGIAITDDQKAELLTADWHLRMGSPCINAGTSNNVSSSILLGNDIDDNLRVQYVNIDIGAYEYIIPAISIPVVENFDNWTDFDNSNVLYNSATISGKNIKWEIENQKAVFSWKTNLTTSYSQPFFTYQIDAIRATEVFLRYDIFFQAYAGTITPLGTEKLNVEFSSDLVTWTIITSYSNQNGSIANKNYLHDISKLAAGKSFYIRFNAIGENCNRIEKWEIDNISIATDVKTAIDIVQLDKCEYSINDGILSISNLNPEAFIHIYDVSGKLMFSKKADSERVYYTLPSHGVFLINILSDAGIKQKKVVW